jgi:hypothetical protein
VGLDHPRREGDDQAVALSGHFGVFVFGLEVVPFGQLVAFGDGAVCFRQAVHVDGTEVVHLHLLEEVRGGGAGGHGHANGVLELLGVGVGQEQRVDRGRRVVVTDLLLFQKLPDIRIVDLSKAVMRAAGCRHGPGKRPSHGVEHGQSPEIVASVCHGMADVQVALNHIA